MVKGFVTDPWLEKDDYDKVLDTQRKMVNNPERARKEWSDTRKDSLKIAAE